MDATALQRAVKAACRPAMPIPMDAVAGNGVLFSGPCLWRGWALCNKNAGSGDIELFDGQDTNGTPIAYSHQASAGNTVINFGDSGLYCAIGLYVVVAVVPWRGSIFYTPLLDHELDDCYSNDSGYKAEPARG